MSAVNKFMGALASASNDVTVSAANFNLDFSLVKVEAPQEYLVLGQSLSKKRRQDAEHSSAHVTAGKLAALFERTLPPSPQLVSAYGLRVSEISASPSVTPQGSATSYGIFADTVSVDATSIWAAATCGRAAVPVHLLACMLAWHWNQSEATSTWVEIVVKRRAEIVIACENNELVHLAALSAARQELTRSQLESRRIYLRLTQSGFGMMSPSEPASS